MKMNTRAMTTKRNRRLAFFTAILMAATLWTGLPLQASAATVSVTYIDASGNTQTQSSATVIETSSTALGTSGQTTWYVVNSAKTISSRITVTGDVRLILMDGFTLTASRGITVNDGNSLTIYGQSGGTGKLSATGVSYAAAIGGESTSSVAKSGGTIIINGGTVSAMGNGSGAGIGGGSNGSSGTITINGGTVAAINTGSGGAGIGGGSTASGNNITINGGIVTATAAGSGGAGIGGGGRSESVASGGGSGTITINGGTVTATGTGTGAGIGVGWNRLDSIGTIAINGGTVTATGSDSNAGIGTNSSSDTSSVTIKNSTVVVKRSEANKSISASSLQTENAILLLNSGTSALTAKNVIMKQGSSDPTFYDSAGATPGTGTATLSGKYVIPADYTLPIPAGKTLDLTGTLTVGGTVNGAGSITGSGTVGFTGSGTVSIGLAAVSNVSSPTYDGDAKIPTMTVKIAGTTLTPTTHYTVTGSNNVNVGSSAQYTITGVNPYPGTKTGTFTITRPALGGSVSIGGTATVNQTLTANTDSLTPTSNRGALSYQWKRDGANISGATSSTYKLVADDIGNTITVTVTAANCSGSVTSAATGMVGKALQGTPDIVFKEGDHSNVWSISSTYGDDVWSLFVDSYYGGDGTGAYVWDTTNNDGVVSIVPSETNNKKVTITFLKAGTATLTLKRLGDATYTDSDTRTVPITVSKANQDAPAAPTLSSRTATSITLNQVTGEEYRKGSDGAWQSSPTFTGLTANTSYTFYARKAEVTDKYNASSASTNASISTAKAALTGTVTISGTATFGQTLTANTGSLSSNPSVTLGTLSYQWKRGGEDISGAAGSTYTLASADIGKTITVTVTAANCDESVTSPATAAVGKAAISPTVTMEGWTYGDTANEPSVSGNTGFGSESFMYSTSQDSGYNSSKPVNAGTYYVKATIGESTNYQSATTAAASFTIAKATNTTLSVTQENITYGGFAPSPKVTGDKGTTILHYKVQNAADTTYTENKPSTVGAYTVRVSDDGGGGTVANYNAATAWADFTINKATPEVHLTRPGIITYGESVTLTATLAKSGMGAVPTGTVTFYDGTTSLEDATISNGTATITMSAPSAGNHTMKAVYNGDTNYNADTASDPITLAVDQKSISGAAVVIETGPWTYNGSEHKPDVTSVTLGGVELTSGTDYSATIGYTSNKDAGTNTAKVTVTGTGNYTGMASTTFSIAKKTITINEAGFTFAPKTYNGTAAATMNGTLTLNDVIDGDKNYVNIVPSNVTFNFTSADAGTTTISRGGTYSLDGTKAGNYELTQPADSFTTTAISKATPTWQDGSPAATNITYGQTVNDSTLSGTALGVGSTVISGNVTWATSVTKTDVPGQSDSTLNAGGYGYAVTFTPTGGDATNYNTRDGTAYIIVDKADGSAVNGAPTGTPSYNASDGHTVTLNTVTITTSFQTVVEYAKSLTSEAPAENNAWQESLVFTGLDPYKDYYFFARAQENAKYLTGVAQTSAAIKTLRTPVNNEGKTATVTYDPNGIDLDEISGLFAIDTNAGVRTYTVEETGNPTGAGEIKTSSTLTVTKSGTFTIGLATAINDTYDAGAKVTATLTVNKKTIDSVSVTLTAPAKGNEPAEATTAAGASTYSAGTVTWTGDKTPEGNFAGDTAYTAEIPLTITDTDNYTWNTSVSADVADSVGAVFNTASGKLTVTYDKLAAKILTGVSVKADAALSKALSSYTHNEALDLTGLVLTAAYDDKTTKDIGGDQWAGVQFKIGSDNVAKNVTLSRTTHNDKMLSAAYTEAGVTQPTDIGTLTIARAEQTGITITDAEETVLSGDDVTKTFAEATVGFNVTASGGESSGTYTWTSGAPVSVTVNPAAPDAAATTAVTAHSAITAENKVTITVTKAADNDYNAGTASFTLAVAQAASAVTLTATPETGSAWGSNTLTATVAKVGGINPTGTVIFYQGTGTGNPLGTTDEKSGVSLTTDASGNGTASLTLVLPVGTYAGDTAIHAVYSGDPNYDAVGGTGTLSSYTVIRAEQNAPSAPELSGKTSTSITLNSIAGAEYSINGQPFSWQAAAQFINLIPNTAYTFVARMSLTDTHNESPASDASESITTGKAALSGTVTISGNAIYGSPLTAVTTGLVTEANLIGADGLGNISYQWKRGSDEIVDATGETYTLVSTDIGQTISVIVSAANCTGTQASDATNSVAQKSLTFTGSVSATKTYDGNVNFAAKDITITGGDKFGDAIENDDEVMLDKTDATGTLESADAETSGALNLTNGFTLSGANAGNYSLQQPVVNANITKRDISFTGTVTATKVYNGNVNFTTEQITIKDEGSFDDKVEGDDVTLSKAGVTGTLGSANVAENQTLDRDGLFSLAGETAKNYTLKAQPEITASITKATSSFGSPGPLSAVYTPTLKLSDITPPNNYLWNAPGTAVSAGDGQIFAATYTNPTGNYHSAGGSITVNVAKADPVVTAAPAAASISKGEPLSASGLTGGEASVAGSFAWTAGGQKPLESGSFEVTFTPDDTANYNNAATAASVRVIDPDDPADTDGDGVPDYIEEQQGTDPNDKGSYKDSDGDGVPDYVEQQQGTDPNDKDDFKDTDGDGVPDYIHPPVIPSDSDGDGVPDYIEEQQGTDPNDKSSFKDTDGDGVPDYVEEQQGTDPNDKDDFNDADGDGVPDYLDPPAAPPDTDGDGVPDYIERQQGTDPNDKNSYKDSDGDGVPDYVEEQQGTDPNDKNSFKDTDGDGVPDYLGTDGWIRDESEWYYYDTVEDKHTGWLYYERDWYLLDRTDGHMLTGWEYDRSYREWFYLAGSGEMKIGWFYDRTYKSWFYLIGNGEMKIGWVYDNRYKAWFYLGGDGRMKTGWSKIDGDWFYFSGNGEMKTGWQMIGGRRYYLGGSNDGRMQG
jgi:hypothetical protein